MKKVIMGILLGLSMGQALAETELEKATVSQFKQDFNNKQFTSIFERFSSQMQTAVPLNRFSQVSTDLQKQLGQLQDIEFMQYKDKLAVYKAIFEGGTLNLGIRMNEHDQIAGLLFSPYRDPRQKSPVATNAIQSYPKAIADKIYMATQGYPVGTQVAIAVYDQGQTQYYGVEQRKNKIQNSQNQQLVFGIGSITKVLTSSILAELVSQNKLKLDDSINTYYSFQFKDGIQLRFQDLANHTSGLPRLPSNLELSSTENPYKAYDEKKLNDYLQKHLNLEMTDNQAKLPNYSNLAVGLLGHSLGLSQKQSFSSLLQQYVFDQYQMKNSDVSVEKVRNKLVPASNEQGEVIATWEFDTLLGAGGVLSSVEDLMKFAQAQLDDNNTVAKLMQQATTAQHSNHKVGLGWFIDAQGGNVVWHGGNTAGHSSILMLDLENKKAVSILANVADGHSDMSNIEKLAVELLK